jgi:uncharacterized protein (UPF0548 family)
MFLLKRPSRGVIKRFLHHSQGLPLSYAPTGISGSPSYDVDEEAYPIGHGHADFERARSALAAWRHFELGWVTAFPGQPSVAVGTDVAVLIRHLGFWSLNGARVLYHVGVDGEERFGFAYGTLTNHAESGEELFEVSIDPQTRVVLYRIRAASRPQSALAWIGLPVVRLLQARFRRDSAAAMRRATAESAPAASIGT